MISEKVQFEPSDELWSLTASMCDGVIDAGGLDRLETILRTDEDARLFYVAYMDLHGRMSWRFRGHRVEESRSRLPDETSRSRLPSGTEFKAEGGRRKAEEKTGRLMDSDSSVSPSLPLPFSPSSLPHSVSPLSSLLSLNTPLGNVAFSYTMSAILVGIGLFIFSLMSASSPRDAVVKDSTAPQKRTMPSLPAPTLEPEIVSVGRITGMVDCKWEDTDYAPAHDRVVQGTKYMLASGLMEITYYTGAKVILQGPCTYVAESAAGGYLSLGKLTARVESRSRLPDGALPTDSDTSKSRTAGGTYFAVRTPTAVVTDLGTEFGVEVAGSGETRSHVYRGKIELVALDGQGEKQGRKLILNANESGCVDKSNGTTNQAAIMHAGDVAAKEFIRYMPASPEGRKLLSRAYADLVLSLKPAVYYRMERPEPGKDPMQIVDSAPGGHHGKAFVDNESRIDKDTPPPIYKPGRFGEAKLFRGQWGREHIIVPDYPKADKNELTVSAWVFAEFPPPQGWAMIAANWGYDTTQQQDGVKGQFYFCLNLDRVLTVGAVQSDGEPVEVCEPGPERFPMNRWRHVAFVADGVMLRLYHNGKEVGASPCQGILHKPPLASLGIGGETNVTGTAISSAWPSYWQGQIDELAVFNRALSLEEVKKLSQRATDKKESIEGK